MKAIVHALECHAADVAPVAPGAWRCALGNGLALACSARIEGDWLVLHGTSPELRAVPDAWTALLLNDRHAAPGGIVLTRSGALALHADVPFAALDPDTLARRVGAVCHGFTHALHRALGDEDEHAAEDGDEAAGADLQALLAEAGWSAEPAPRPAAPHPVEHATTGSLAFSNDPARRGGSPAAGSVAGGVATSDAAPGGPARHDETVSIVLAGPRQSYRARVHRVGGSISALVPLDDRLVPSSTCREALARHLLRAAGEVRLVRAAATVQDDRVRARFAVRFAAGPAPVELGHGLAALGVACEQYGPECAVLAGDARIAGRFLRARDGARPLSRTAGAEPRFAGAGACPDRPKRWSQGQRRHEEPEP